MADTLLAMTPSMDARSQVRRNQMRRGIYTYVCRDWLRIVEH